VKYTGLFAWMERGLVRASDNRRSWINPSLLRRDDQGIFALGDKVWGEGEGR